MVRTNRLVPTCLALGLAALVPSLALAQTGSIAGVVKDASGAVMPGVVVEATSPALIEKVRSATTDEKGQYKIVDLRPGIYTVTFTLPGFNTYKREGIELTTQFTAPVNAELKVGDITETVTVTGESPVVDTQRIQQVKVMTRDVIDAVPTGKTFQNIGVLVPGVTVAAGGTGATPYDVGGSSGEQQVQMAIHGGATADMVVQMDGMRFNNLCGSGSYTGVSGNDGAVEQIAFETGAISAEMGTGGIRVNMIPKEGGNRFKGSFFANGATSSFQSDNFTQSLRDQGLAAVNRVKRVWDVNGSLGGPIKKNTLWFYFASRYWGLDKYPADSFYDADPRYYVYAPNRSSQGVDDTWNKSNSVRLTWQASARNKITAFVDLQDRLTGHWFIGQGGIFGLTTPEASWVQTTPINHLAQFKYTATASSRLLVEAGMSIYDQEYTREPQDGITTSTLSVRDNATGRRIDAAPYYSEHFSVLRTYTASVSYVTGSHAAKFGMNMSEGPRHEVARVNGDMTLVYNTSTTNCLPGETAPCSAPIQAILTASPRDARERLNADLGLYAQDQWTINRLTINAGLRFDYLNAKLEAQDFPAGTFVPARHADEIADLPSWKDLNPRLGLSWDVRGDGKTAVKTTLSRYVASQTVGFASQFNPLGGTVTGAGFSGTGADTRVWTDPNGDRLVQLDEQSVLRHQLPRHQPGGRRREGMVPPRLQLGILCERPARADAARRGQRGVLPPVVRQLHAHRRAVGRAERLFAVLHHRADRFASAALRSDDLRPLRRVGGRAPEPLDQPPRRFRGSFEALAGVQRRRPDDQRAQGQTAPCRRHRIRQDAHGELRNLRQPRRAVLRQLDSGAHPAQAARLLHAAVRRADQRHVPKHPRSGVVGHLEHLERDRQWRAGAARPQSLGRHRVGRADGAEHGLRRPAQPVRHAVRPDFPDEHLPLPIDGRRLQRVQRGARARVQHDLQHGSNERVAASDRRAAGTAGENRRAVHLLTSFGLRDARRCGPPRGAYAYTTNRALTDGTDRAARTRRGDSLPAPFGRVRRLRRARSISAPRSVLW